MKSRLKIVRVAGASALLIMSFAVAAQQQSLDEAAAACMEAADLIGAGDIAAALEEAQWCVESLEQLKQQRTLTLFPDELNGFTGAEVQNQSAMGMNIIERVYENADRKLTVTLTSGVAGGGLAALAQLGMGLGTAAGTGKKIRVQRRTVINMSQPGANSEYMVQLKSGGMLMIKSASLDDEQLLEFVREFPIADLDDALAE
jgi:hypothetical protein